MTSTQHPDPRPSSPWAGSQHETRHRWQLDGAADLLTVVRVVEELAVELTAAHHAGWWLVEPMRAGQ